MSNHTFSFKQSSLEAMTNVKLTQSRRLLKKKKEYKGLRAKHKHFRNTQLFFGEILMHSEALAGREKGPERVQI